LCAGKSIRHGHPTTLHLWWARRPLAAARAVIFAQMVNDAVEGPFYLQNPFDTEPGWGVSSVNFDLKSLLERAQEI